MGVYLGMGAEGIRACGALTGAGVVAGAVDDFWAGRFGPSGQNGGKLDGWVGESGDADLDLTEFAIPVGIGGDVGDGVVVGVRSGNAGESFAGAVEEGMPTGGVCYVREIAVGENAPGCGRHEGAFRVDRVSVRNWNDHGDGDLRSLQRREHPAYRAARLDEVGDDSADAKNVRRSAEIANHGGQVGEVLPGGDSTVIAFVGDPGEVDAAGNARNILREAAVWIRHSGVWHRTGRGAVG